MSNVEKISENDEIRLILICEYYNALFSGKQVRNYHQISSLTNITDSVINANVIYLIDKGLLRGEISYTTSGAIPFITRITDLGIDKVELIVKRSENEVDENIANKIKQAGTTAEKVLTFTESCLKLGSICKIAVEHAHEIFSSLS